jgi:predicted Zn-ribbon and HTH transcriptional regulator
MNNTISPIYVYACNDCGYVWFSSGKDPKTHKCPDCWSEDITNKGIFVGNEPEASE